jgi:hypothetical protein
MLTIENERALKDVVNAYRGALDASQVNSQLTSFGFSEYDKMAATGKPVNRPAEQYSVPQ